MEETARTRTGAALGFGALAGCFALAAPALAIPPKTITQSNVSAPAGPFYSVFDSSITTNPKFTFSGTSDGDTTDTVDIRCYTGGTSYNTVVAGVPVNADGTFSSAPTDLGNVYDDNCKFRAIQSGNNPSDLSSFTGPWAGVSESDISKISTGGPNDGTRYDFFADIWQRAGHVEYDSISNCGISAMYVMSPLSRQSSGGAWGCSATLGASDPLANGSGRSEIEIDGRQAYGSSAADNLFSGGPNSADNSGFPALTSSVAQDGTTGNGTINESEAFVACPDGPGNYPATSSNCASFIGTGIKLDRSISQSDDGRTVAVTDSFSSTDGAAHQLKLHYQNGENTCCGGPDWTWPGQESASFANGDIVDGPFNAPDTLLAHVEHAAPTSVTYPALALTWDTAPTRARYFGGGCCPSSSPAFLLDYDVSVPAGGTKALSFVYQASPSDAGIMQASTRARDAFGAPTVTIDTPANGATVNTATVNVGGKALDNVGVASLVVNGTSVTPAADGTYSVPVTLAVGANTLTATVKDAAGNSATATETVTYKPAPAPKPKCVVPSVKRGSKVSTAKKLLVKAHCRAGKTRKQHSSKVKKGRVISLAHKAGKRYPAGTKIAIIVSSGKKK